MLISASFLETGNGSPYTFGAWSGHRGLRIPRWKDEDAFVYCDICGTNIRIANESRRDGNSMPYRDVPLPKGWTTIRDMHVCPSCACETPEQAEMQSPPSEAAIPHEAVLTPERASKLLPNKDGTVVIPEGFRSIGYKAFMYRSDIAHVAIPNTLTHIGSYAFSCSTIESIDLPCGIVSVGDKAFYQCKHLEHVTCSEQLASIGEEAFAGCPIDAIMLPKSLAYLGGGAFSGTNLVMEGADATIVIDPDNPHLAIDEAGGLYVNTKKGHVLFSMLSRLTRRHMVAAGTWAIRSNAYARNGIIEEIVLPEGLEHIGQGAFSGCFSLRRVELPSTLRTIGSSAFVHTAIERLDLPASLTGIEPFALDISDGEPGSPLRTLTVDESNPRFFMSDSYLCARNRDGDVCIIRYLGHERDIDLPHDAAAIGPHAFSDLDDNCTMHLDDTLRSIHPHALPYEISATCIVNLEHELCGRDYALVRNPTRYMLVRCILDGTMDIELLLTLCDLRTLLARDKRLVTSYALDRLDCPQYFDERIRTEYENKIRKGVREAVIAFVKHGELEQIERMARWNLLTRESITSIIDEVSHMDDTAATACLFDIKQRLFGTIREDFSL